MSPFLAYDTAATLTEARRLWRAVERENLMIKVPATTQGIAAIRPLIADGINVNATLLFGQEPYERPRRRIIAGLEDLAARGGALERVASVASFFVSRIDQSIEELSPSRLELPIPAAADRALRQINGKVAIANAKLAYQTYQDIFSRPAVAGAGAPRRADAAAAVGQHRRQEPALQRRPLRRGTGRTRHGHDDAAGHARCVPRSRTAARQPH